MERNGFTAVGFSADSKTLLTGGHNGRVRFWDVASRQEYPDLGSPSHGITIFALSADGKLLATGTEGEKVIRLWDPVTKRERRQIAGLLAPPAFLSLSANGKLLATASNPGNRIQLWDVDSGQELFPSSGHVSGLRDLFLAPGGKTLVTASIDRTARSWDLVTGETRRVFAGLENQFFVAALSPDGKRLALGGDSTTIRMMDSATGKETASFPSGHGGVTALTFNHDGSVLLGAGVGAIRLWDSASGKVIAELAGPSSGFALAVSADGKWLASAGQEALVRIWDLKARRELHQLTTQTTCQSLAFSPDGSTLASGGSRLRLWDSRTGKERPHLGGLQGPVQSVAFSPDGRLLASCGLDRSVVLLDTAAGQIVAPPLIQKDICNCLAFSSDSKALITGSFDSTALVWVVDALLEREGAKVRELDRKDLDALWEDLGGAHAGLAHRAVWKLARQPKVVGYLKERLAEVKPDRTAERIQKGIVELDDEDFHKRESASAGLKTIGPQAIPALREVLQKKPSLEVRWRAEALLEALASRQEDALTSEQVRAIRAVQALERVGTPAAQDVLRGLSKGADRSLAREASEALDRLSRRAARE